MLYFAEGQHAFQPYVLYRSFPDYAPQIEAGGVFHINHLLWVGGIYRQNFGYSGLLGIKIQDLSVGYAYDYASNNITGINQSSHEIQITYTIGLKSAWTEQYSTFLSSQHTDRPERPDPPTKDQNPRFHKGQKYIPD